MDQIQQLKTNLAKVRPLISSCPACQENFFQMFCHFTCSPNQSTFVNVTQVGTSSSGNDVVDELDFYIDGTNFATGFFESCKNIKFGATNGYAMDLIGGGAQNYSQFLKFLGDKKPFLGGSPFQMNMVYDRGLKDQMEPFTTIVRNCNDSDPNFRCSCADCPQACPVLPQVKRQQKCTVGGIPCFSFTVATLYAAILVGYTAVVTFIRGKKPHSLFGLHESALLADDSNDVEVDGETGLLDDGIDSDLVTPPTGEDEEGGGGIPDDDITDFESFKASDSYYINDWLENVLYKQGSICARHPWRIITSTFVIAGILCLFTFKLELERDPVHLWVSPKAEAFRQKQVFDDSFGPFYRAEQLFVSNATQDSILQNYDFVKWWFEKETEIQSLKAGNTTYSNICFKPTGGACAVESFTQYFHGDIRYLPETTWKQKISDCAASPVNCLPSFQQPLKRSLIFGGNASASAIESPAFVVTFLANNEVDQASKQVLNAQSWEEKFEEYVSEILIPEAQQQWGVNISYTTEISVEKELNKSTNTDIRIVVISYLVMFAYVSIALGTGSGSNSKAPTGKAGGPLQLLTRTRFGLGLTGIFIVLLSVFASVGICSLFGLKSTLIIAEVIPFLVLAVGVDNIFLLCNELRDINYLNVTNELQLEERVAKTLSNVGPSILLSSTIEVSCFLLATVVNMPAVRNFAVYSAFAIFFNTLLQLTAFVSVLALDQKRLEQGRLDLLTFMKVPQGSISLPEDSEAGDSVNHQANLSQLLSGGSLTVEAGFFTRLIRKHLSSIFTPRGRRFVLLFFAAWLGISLSLFPEIQLGLDQRLAMPTDSHLVEYFGDMYKYLNVGPPIYWVVDGLNVSSIEGQRHLCGKFTTCDSMSLVNILQQEYKRQEVSSIAEPTASWIDDFLLWLNPDLTDCCRVKKTPAKLSAKELFAPEEFCLPRQPPRQCKSCYEEKKWDFQMDGFPEGSDFNTYFNEWIQSPSDPCPLGGKAPYSSSVYVKGGQVARSSFRNSHTPLRSQQDFIDAYHDSLRIVNEVKKEQPQLNLFAYSPFYIFFVQYENIISLAIKLVCVGLALVFVLASFLLGSFLNSSILALNVGLIMINVAGAMAVWNISLNAVSLVNLMICLGLAVEFSVHLVRHFNFNSNYQVHGKDFKLSRKLGRAYNSLEFIGSTTLSGITMTKLIGIAVLGFTRSKIFQVYYFRMWLSLIIVSSLHSLILLPILLGYLGADRNYKTSSSAAISNEEVLRRLREVR
ncbi:DEKNAAC101992 [Brettanomyces naardenensis]|uniref:DEKNAAC101992 n=1 Tax=Brettanomyces naardenensis TaxID=13370 RepID=A0A448YJN1_BRENA|nr:DEKNAAC101992 [Brettanomyces naardenensis]